MADVLAERDVVAKLRDRVVHVHVRGVATNFGGQPHLKGKGGRCVVDREVEDLSGWQPTDVNGGYVELHILQNLFEGKR